MNAPHRRSDAQDDLERVPACVNGLWVSWREGIRGSCESCAGHPGTETQDDVGNAGSEKGNGISQDCKRTAKFIDKLGHNRVALRCDTEPAIEALAREIAQARQEGSQTVPERPPAGESQSNGIIERAVGLKAALEHRIGARVPPVARILCWLVEFLAYLMNRCDIGRDGVTPLQRLHGRNMPAKPARGETWAPRFYLAVFLGMLDSSSEAVVVTEQGLAMKRRAANVRRILESERWDADRIL